MQAEKARWKNVLVYGGCDTWLKLDLSTLLLLSRHAELVAVLLIRFILNRILKNTVQS